MEIWKRRIGRREFLQATAAASAMGALPLLDACGQSGGGPSIPTNAPGKPLTLANIQSIPTLDPDKTAADSTRSVIMAICDGLVDYDIDKRQVVPRLATSWKVIDDKTMEFKLRSGVKFSNGEPV